MAGPGAQAALVRRYRLLLRCYPAAYRDARGEELLGTLLDDARPGQRIPSVRDAADLVFHGLRRRLRDDATPGLAAGLAVAAPIALALGAGLAGFLLLAGEIRPLGGAGAGIGRFGPFHTMGTIAYATWLLAAAGNAFAPRAVRRDLIIGAAAATVLVLPAAVVFRLARPPVWVVAGLTLFAAIAVGGSACAAPRIRRRRVLVATPVVALVPTVAVYLWPPAPPGEIPYDVVYYDAALHLCAGVVAVAMIALAVAGVRAAWAGTPARRWWWALLTLAVPAVWFVNVDVRGLGRLAQFLLTASAAAAAIGWLARHPVRLPVRRGVTGAVALASAAGLAAVLWLVAATGPGPSALESLTCAAWLAVAAAWTAVPPTGIRVLCALATGLTMVTHYLGTQGIPAPITVALAVLGLVALVDRAPAGPRYRLTVPAGALLVVLAGLAIGAYDHNWQLHTWRDLIAAPGLVATLAVPPFAAGVVAGCHAVRYHRGRAALRDALIAVCSAGGAGWLLAPHTATAVVAPAAVAAFVCYRRLASRARPAPRAERLGPPPRLPVTAAIDG